MEMRYKVGQLAAPAAIILNNKQIYNGTNPQKTFTNVLYLYGRSRPLPCNTHKFVPTPQGRILSARQ